MDKLNINWKTSTLKGFKQYLHIVNPILGDKKLSPQEIEVLSCYIYLDNYYKHLPVETKNTIVFSKNTKLKIKKELKSSSDSINNVISSLYKKGYISKDKKLLVKIPLKDNKIEISFSITISDEGENNLIKDIEPKKPID